MSYEILFNRDLRPPIGCATLRPAAMLLSYAFSNFHSFAERTQVSLKLNQRDAVHGWDRTSPSGQRASTALAVMGANGAGKTSLVKALVFLAYFVRFSFNADPKSEIPFVPHLAATDEASEFEAEADDVDGVHWRYVLRVTQTRVLHEALYRKGERMGYVFIRDWNEAIEAYDVKQQGFGLAPSEANKVRQNVSLISWAQQYGVDVASHVAGFIVTSNLDSVGRERIEDSTVLQAAEFFAGHDALQTQMRSLLTSWDLGLSDIRLRRYEHAPTERGAEGKVSWVPWGVHNARGRSFELPFGMESSGTQTALVLLWRLLPVLAFGGVAVIDELENDMHPHMIEPILQLFDGTDTNPHGAQVIFTTQSAEVLRFLSKSQVMLVEKTDCESMAYRGDDIQGLTSAQNLYGKYMSGALGAVPQI
jgi:uncharacterized protein